MTQREDDLEQTRSVSSKVIKPKFRHKNWNQAGHLDVFYHPYFFMFPENNQRIILLVLKELYNHYSHHVFCLKSYSFCHFSLFTVSMVFFVCQSI